MDLKLNGKTALVTGASMGLGRAICKTLAAEGVQVMGVARSADLLQSLVEEIRDAGDLVPLRLIQDFVAPDAPQRIAAAALERLQHVDILINCAGGSRPMAIDAPESEWIEGMTLNFDRHRQLTQQLLAQFIERKSGTIINISGNLEPEVVNAAIVAKAGLVAWSKGLSEQLGQYGVTVNCVQPGLIDTAQIRRLYPGDARRDFAERNIALGDFGEPIDVANAVTFLASPLAHYITGTIVTVDGGMRGYSF
ncbi:SDR family NAD(P)-dependent oxidoreductase [Pseudomonas nunensis]|uniref:SDR family oxidoreductase n=1 Tax=Pseudomonas nunensis TaxID=2961896 RepID=A0ABY5ENH4_9PSED|nr:SDR family oxidoreductase [Pseudomonas nunensis]KPN89751.1 3-oxoacyl-ACP reductase [Pseudomonas nunensis]MCL5229293.1 SDR family oxidoreductase [Pseudomonas nunensis]UTO15973.1 SDR family oxidoreductase [Pseudomonas nunensis]